MALISPEGLPPIFSSWVVAADENVCLLDDVIAMRDKHLEDLKTLNIALAQRDQTIANLRDSRFYSI